MEKLLADIAHAVKESGPLGAQALGRILARHNKRFPEPQRHFAKKQLAEAYARTKRENPALWGSWQLSAKDERNLYASVQMKPRRTASGVATITVITKPHPCAGRCLYCPNDVRMPKSYLHAEPACQRAKRCCFDPYLQVASRLAALERMGHATDKVELIVLGGSFTDYPRAYQAWFVRELFHALNDAGEGTEGVADVFADHDSTEDGAAPPSGKQETGNEAIPCSSVPLTVLPPFSSSKLAQGAFVRLAQYENAGVSDCEEGLEHQAAPWQERIRKGSASYNEAVEALYGDFSPWGSVAAWQEAELDEVSAAQERNEEASHRCVGLVVETRPDAVNAGSLELLRQLGCTKLQLGVQTLNEGIARACNRPIGTERIREAFELVRAFGFKSHAHFMANLPLANPASDIADYRAFVEDAAIAPDEVKLYPCVLLEGTGLQKLHESGQWHPYAEQELVEVLAADVLATPAHTRISRMVRDFSSQDIAAGNRKTNLRQMVEEHVAQLVAGGADPVQEIRMREIATKGAEAGKLSLEEDRYETTNSTEVFLQWVLPAADGECVRNRIAGFLRLSLPHRSWIKAHAEVLPIRPNQAMIREVHVYGAAARLHEPTSGAQHQGLGRALVEHACEIACEAGYASVNVISAVGTRNYYRNLGFADAGLYLNRLL